MSKRTIAPSSYASKIALDELREQVFKNKAEYRSYLAQAPVMEKLRILEEMRDFTGALQNTREENKARMKGAWIKTENSTAFK